MQFLLGIKNIMIIVIIVLNYTVIIRHSSRLLKFKINATEKGKIEDPTFQCSCLVSSSGVGS